MPPQIYCLKFSFLESKGIGFGGNIFVIVASLDLKVENL